MQKVRLGYLGVGPRAQALIECYSMHPQVEFIAFADIATNCASDVAALYNKNHDGDAKAYTSYEKMMQEMEAAGINAITEEVNNQLDQWYNTVR